MEVTITYTYLRPREEDAPPPQQEAFLKNRQKHYILQEN